MKLRARRTEKKEPSDVPHLCALLEKGLVEALGAGIDAPVGKGQGLLFALFLVQDLRKLFGRLVGLLRWRICGHGRVSHGLGLCRCDCARLVVTASW